MPFESFLEGIISDYQHQVDCNVAVFLLDGASARRSSEKARFVT